MVLQALDEAGGTQYLARQAEQNPVSFLSLLGKLVPREVTVQVTATTTLEDLVCRAGEIELEADGQSRLSA